MSRRPRFHSLAIAGLLALTVFCSEASAETWVGYQGGPDGNAARASDPTLELGKAWTTGGSIYATTSSCVTYGDGVVYTSIEDLDGSGFRLYAFDADDGSVLWKSTPHFDPDCPTPDGDQVLTTFRRPSESQSVLTMFDSTDGSIIWQHEMRAFEELHSRQGVTVADGKVFTFSRYYANNPDELALVAFDLDDGAEVWRRPGASQGKPPIVHGEVVIVASTSPYESTGIIAYDTDDGTDLGWVSGPEDDLQVSLMKGGVLFYRHDLSSIQARDIASGDVLWTRNFGSSYRVGNPVADESNLYIPTTKWNSTLPNRLGAFDQADGSVVWPSRFLIDSDLPLFLLGGKLILGAGWFGERAILDIENGERVADGSGFPWDVSAAEMAYGDHSFYSWHRYQGGEDWELVATREVDPPELELTSPALDGSYQAADHEFTWTAADGNGVGLEGFEITVNGQAPVMLGPGERTFALEDLPVGENQVLLTAADINGNETTVSRDITVVPSPTPVATIDQGMPDVVLSGKAVELSALESQDMVLDGGIVGYEWDLDGDGNFEFDAGGSATVDVNFEQPGEFQVGLRVTNKAGNTDTDNQTIDVRHARLAGAGQPGVSINEAETFTNDPEVKLRISWPEYAKSMIVSKDGGFADSQTRSLPLPDSGYVDWKLDSTGPERLPKQVYIRFTGSGVETVTYTDDIILDETPPVIEQATVIPDGTEFTTRAIAPRAASISRKKNPKRYKVRLKAKDSTSGVIAIQVAKTPKTRGPIVQTGGRTARLRKVINPRVGYRPKLIRVKDAAGNWSSFRTIK